MNNKKSILSLLLVLVLILSACKEEEHYESKNLPIKSVFDDMAAGKDNTENKDNERNDNQAVDEDNPDDNRQTQDDTFVIQYKANARSAPEFGDNILGQIDPGTEVTILERNVGQDKNWAKISYNDQEFYMSMDFFQ